MNHWSVKMSILKRLYHKLKRFFDFEKNPVIEYKGNFASFSDANANIASHPSKKGYDAETIFKKVSNSTLKVISGEAVYERDSFLFYEKQINYNLMMYLYRIFIHENKLSLLDFGGALGSTYFQHKSELDEIGAKWIVTEQDHFVKFGKEKVAGGNLEFASNEELVNNYKKFNVILFSSVLQYIENSDSLINQICEKKVKNIIIERTPVSDRSWFWIETVHEPIYEAVYPCCVFKESSLVKLFTDNGYTLIDSWKSLVDGDIYSENRIVEFKSFVFELT